MRGTRIVRYVGNREKPEESLYSNAEILHDWPLFPKVDFDAALKVEGLKGIKKVTFDDITKAIVHQLVQEVIMSPAPEPAFTFGFSETTYNNKQNQAERPQEREFETNMVEPLEGWKVWSMSAPGCLISEYDGSPWLPMHPFRAYCFAGCGKIPAEHHTCGIYASTDAPDVSRYRVCGQIYGWGRYIRGEYGWRAEFAYPKNLYIAEDQMEWFELLKRYQVPIYVFQPVKMYDPREEGYASEYREAQENGGLGASQESDAEEDSGAGEED